MKRISLAGLLGFTLLALALFALAQLVIALLSSEASAQSPVPTTDDGIAGTGPIRRLPWFQNLWQERRSEWAKPATIAAEQGAVVFFGDSITQGWEANGFETTFDDLNVANRGISGDTTRGMLLRLEEDVLALNPSGIVLLMGTNDLEEGAPAASTVGNVELILEAIRAHNADVPVILNLIFPSSEEKDRPATKIQALNTGLAELVRGMPHVTVIDTWTLFADEKGDAKPSQFPDLLHPNGAGYERWAASLRPILATLGFLETEAEPFDLEEGFVSLFNGEDLTGWGFRKTAPRKQPKKPNPNAPVWGVVTENATFDGLRSSPDGRYQAVAGRLVVTTPTEGRRIQQLWTTEEFPTDFILRLEFRATPNADSGVFIRKPQLQCRDYLTAGPYTELQNYRPQGWNTLEVTVTGDTAQATCNGEVLEEAMKLPATGPIGLEGDRGQIEYRRIRVQALVDSLQQE